MRGEFNTQIELEIKSSIELAKLQSLSSSLLEKSLSISRLEKVLIG